MLLSVLTSQEFVKSDGSTKHSNNCEPFSLL